MSKEKVTLEYEIVDFLHTWGSSHMRQLILDLYPLLQLYDVDEEDDWLKDVVGELDVDNVRLIRTVYILSRFAENHAGKLVELNVKFKKLWKKMEKEIGKI